MVQTAQERWEARYRTSTMRGPAPTHPVGVRASTTYLPELEALRGVGVALVFGFHADRFVHFPLMALGAPASPALAFVRAGHTGVDLFFVLSAFLLAQPFLAEVAGAKRVDRRQYFTRRALRILPPNWVGSLPTAGRCSSCRSSVSASPPSRTGSS